MSNAIRHILVLIIAIAFVVAVYLANKERVDCVLGGKSWQRIGYRWNYENRDTRMYAVYSCVGREVL